MNKDLINFIELCLSDGVISEKEREVIFRKSKELGVPEDECEIILNGMIVKYSGKIEEKESKKDTENYFENEITEVINLNFEETTDETLKKLFESSVLEKINKTHLIKSNIETELETIEKKVFLLQDSLNELEVKISNLLKENQELIKKTEFNTHQFNNNLKNYIDKNPNYKDCTIKINFTEGTIELFEERKGFFGNKLSGDLKIFNLIDFFDKFNIDSKFHLNKQDLNTLNEIKDIFLTQKKEINDKKLYYEEKINRNKKILKELLDEENLNKINKFRLEESKQKIIFKIDEQDKKTEEFKKKISNEKFNLFKRLYNESPILFQSTIFSKYLEVVQVNNDKQIENLTRYLNFIIKKEKEYSNEISQSFKKLEDGEFWSFDLKNLLSIKNNLKTFYNSFHIMYQSVVSGKLGVYMKIYIELETLGIFNTYFEQNVVNNLEMMNKKLDGLNHTLNSVSNEISKTNNYLHLLNTRMYELKLSVDETNLNLNDISLSIQDGNKILESGMKNIDSTLQVGNLINLIQTYQVYKINKNTKSLRD